MMLAKVLKIHNVNLMVLREVDASSIVICQNIVLPELCRYLTAYIWKVYRFIVSNLKCKSSLFELISL